MTNNFHDLITRMANELDEYQRMLVDDCTITHWLSDAARASLAEAGEPTVPEGKEPAAVTGRPSDEELWELYQGPGTFSPIEYARAVLARWGHQPAPPVDGEAAELVAWLQEEADIYDCIGCEDSAAKCNRAAELLQRQTLAPVSVSERLPGPEDCAPWPQPSDKSGWCWMSRTIHGFYGRFAIWEQVSVVPTCREVYTHWLPAHALPLPEVGE